MFWYDPVENAYFPIQKVDFIGNLPLARVWVGPHRYIALSGRDASALLARLETDSLNVHTRDKLVWTNEEGKHAA